LEALNNEYDEEKPHIYIGYPVSLFASSFHEVFSFKQYRERRQAREKRKPSTYSSRIANPSIKREYYSPKTPAPKSKHKIFDERTGMTIHYDRIATGADYIKIFQEMTPKLAAKYAKANIKMYLRGTVSSSN